MKKYDTRLLTGRIAFLACGKSDTRHFIGLHRFANENLLCGFSVCKSQYVYNKCEYMKVHIFELRRMIKDMINHRSYAHNLSSCEIKA